MAKSVLALKLTSSTGRTRNHPTRRFGGIKLRVGMTVKRRRKGDMVACGGSAVHAYKSLQQLTDYDDWHCGFGLRGIVWLVRLRNPRSRGDDKLMGTSYTVLKRLGTLSACSLDLIQRTKIAKLLRGEKI